MADKVYIQNGGIFFEPGSATEAVFVSNGQIHYQPAGAGVSIPILAYHYNHSLRK